MDVEKVLCFKAIVQYKTFQEAAYHMNLSQSALSKKIQKLEAELDVSLFDRSKRNVELTEAGQILLEHADPLLSEYYDLISDLKTLQKNDDSRGLVFGCVYFGEQNPIVPLLEGFSLKYPSIQVESVDGTTMELLNKILLREVDVAVVSKMRLIEEEEGIPHDERLLFQKVWTSPYNVLMPKENPLSKRECLDYIDLKNEKLLSPYRDMSVYHDMFKKEFNKAGISYEPQYFSSVRALHSFVERGTGYTILSGFAQESSDKIAAIPLKHPIVRDTYLVVLAKRCTKEAKQFYEFARQYTVADIIV